MTCSTSGCCPTSPKCVALLALRIAFGGSLALIGLIHLLSLNEFVGMVSGSLGPLTGLGKLWAYILPVLQIVGGGLIVANYRMDIAAWCAGVALASITIGMMLKPVLGDATPMDVMPAVNNTFLWLLVYALVIKCSCCKEGSCSASSGGGTCS